jgi:hypothetical protein
MARVPVKLRLTLRGGSVYYFVDRALASPEPHFFIVVNRDPLGDELLLLTVVSSQVDKVKRIRRTLPGTLVELGPALYDELTKESIVDCNQVFSRTLEEFVELFERRQIRHHKDLPKDLLANIRDAIRASPVVSAASKALL